jgi:hypothetical protein
VYYRKKYKDKIRVLQQQHVREDSVFGNRLEDFIPGVPTCPANGAECSKNATKMRKYNTPVSTKALRRSSRLKVKLDGHKPKAATPVQRHSNKNKVKSRKVVPQPDLLENILLPSQCQSIEFPGLSDISNCKDSGTAFPKIPVLEIQKLATEKCHIAPSEVTAELLLASRPVEANSNGSSTCDLQLVINARQQQ